MQCLYSKYRNQNFLAIITIYLLIACLHTAHFYFYFEQPLLRSIDWSFTIWAVWFVLMLGTYPLIKPHLPNGILTQAVILIGIALLISFVHIIILISLNFIWGTMDRPFWDDVVHLFNKRWHTNLIIFGLFWISLELWTLKQKNPTDKKANLASKIKVEDGKTHIWLTPSKIEQISSEGNYVQIIGLSQNQLIRSTLKKMTELLIPYGFTRASRSSLINLNMVASYNFSNAKKPIITMQSSSMINVGLSYKASLEQLLETRNLAVSSQDPES